MLEIKNICKKYRTKNGVITKALDDVSLVFPETGMIFILGKSGSGKSTLLNVCGGLDKPDSGEIIIKGKSSKSFSSQDFDSYRNTYVGFVFQEYNVLNEFTVADNIALALELQNKKNDRAAVDKILDEVDMRGLAQRKPNTLSGGQKQRVAIARALVKSPEIIMADEPTGALDSATGKQVFDTLKKLSETKLVLVVSHDRDFAEQYADRIIELKDGKVISDQARRDADGKQNVRFFGTDTVCVDDGAALTDDDMAAIKSFLSKSGKAVITSSDEHIAAVQKDAPELSVGAFEEIESQPESKSYPQQKLIRSHLPMRHAIKVGASSLLTKPVRLVFTILLSVAAFVMFGFASTLMLFSEKDVTVKSLVNSEYEHIVVGKQYWETVRAYQRGKLVEEEESRESTYFTYDEFVSYRDKYNGAVAAVDYSAEVKNFSITNIAAQFYSNTIDGFILSDQSIKIVEGGGRLPTASDEVAISDYLLAGLMSENGALVLFDETSADDGKEIKIKSAADVLYSDANPVLIDVNGYKFKIVGVYEGAPVPKAFADLKKAADENRRIDDLITYYQWMTTRSQGLFARLAVTEDFMKSLVSDRGLSFDISEYFRYNDYMLYFAVGSSDRWASARMAARYGDDELETLPLFDLNGAAVSSLGTKTVALPQQEAAGLFYGMMTEYYNENDLQESDTDGAIWDLTRSVYDIYCSELTDESEIKAIFATVGGILDEWGLPLTFTLEADDYYVSTTEVTLGAVYYVPTGNSCYLSDDLYSEYFWEHTYTSDWKYETETKYIEPDDAFIASIYVPFDKSNSLATDMVNRTYMRADDDSTVGILNPIMDEISIVTSIVDILWKVFLVYGLVLALFAFLLMFNFISASISAKKKEIGILRAIGARTADVFKIFLSEAYIIGVACFVFSCIFSFAVCTLLNFIIIRNTMFSISLFVFGPLSVLCVFALAAVTTTVATVIPVARFSAKPPVDSIRAL